VDHRRDEGMWLNCGTDSSGIERPRLTAMVNGPVGFFLMTWLHVY
jgi:hypothetical protein